MPAKGIVGVGVLVGLTISIVLLQVPSLAAGLEAGALGAKL